MSTPKNDGGPAFPTTPTGETISGVTGGLSVRDWFAGQALAGIIADHEGKQIIAKAIKDPDGFGPAIAKGCYLFAEAMLAEREAKK